MISSAVTRRRLAAVWRVTRTPSLLLSPVLAIVGVNDSYAEATFTRPDEIMGKRVFDVLPDNPAVAESQNAVFLRASLERVLARLQTDDMPLTRYDVRDRTGAFVERYWKPSNRPVVDGRSGKVEFVLHTVTDETDRVLRERAAVDGALQAVGLAAGESSLDEDSLIDRARVFADAESRIRFQTRLEGLTAREKEVLKLAIRGMLSKGIAFEMGLSVRTVEVHRANILKKLKVRNFFELTWSIKEVGLISPSKSTDRNESDIEAALRHVLAGRVAISRLYDVIERFRIARQSPEEAEKALQRFKLVQSQQEDDLRKLLYHAQAAIDREL